MESGSGKKTLFISNLSHRVTDDLIYELCLQAGPIENCSITNKPDRLAIIEYKHEASVPYAIDVFNETVLHGRKLVITAENPYLQPTDYGPREAYYEPPYQRNRNYSQQNNYARSNEYSGHDKFRNRDYSGRHDDGRRRHQPYHRDHYEEHPRMRRYDGYNSGGHRY